MMECKHYPFPILDIHIGLGKRLPSMRVKSANDDPTHRHVDLKGNLIKAMMVMNWLNMLEVENF